MIRLLLLVCFSLSSIKNSFSQQSKMDELFHKMFFNIFLNKPDSMVYDFVKEHFPEFTAPAVKADWTIYPPGHDTLPVPVETMYSLTFRSHPYFKAAFKEGRLDLLSIGAKGYQERLNGFLLWFMFDSKKEAEKAFTVLSNMFEPLSKSKKFRSENNRKIAAYSDQKDFDRSGAIEFILTQDELYNGKYKILFRLGAYTYDH
jgi:hypothetical protein